MKTIHSEQSTWGLPSKVVTRSGACFDPRHAEWSYTDENNDVSIKFDLLPPLSQSCLLSVKLVLIRFAEERAPSTLRTTFGKVNQFLTCLHQWNGAPVSTITEIDLINFKGAKREGLRVSGEVLLGQLGGVFHWWREMGLPGFTEEAGVFLDSVTLKSNETGERVRIRCPIHGPFTDIEQQNVIYAMDNLFAAGEVSESMYMATWLINALGVRPKQLAAMKVCDLRAKKDEDGEVVYQIDVPRAKQPDSLARDAFTVREVIRELGIPLLAYAHGVGKSHVGRLADPSQAPLFPATAGMADNKTGTFRFHASPPQFHYWLKVTWKKIKVISERTGEALRVHAHRFRYTFGTRMAQENCTLEQIAAGLDHTNVNSAAVYIASTPEIAIRLDEKVASTVAPLAHAFLFKRLIKDGTEATRREDLSSRIIDMRTDRRKPVGSCGTESGCGLLKPLACYSCSSFEPWLDGPHQQLAERLMAERERFLEGGARIASINDQTILSVLYVARVCGEESKRRGMLHG